MRRKALIFGLFLTLTSGVWSSALAALVSACCTDEAVASHFIVASSESAASDEHDCCRAKLGEPDAPHSVPAEHAHDDEATHEDAPEPTADASHAGMGCAGERERETKASAFGERSCLECCAGRGNQIPATATLGAPEQSKVKRDAPNVSAAVPDWFAPDAHGVAHLAPSQHAPPAPVERRHKLINVFLI